MVFAFTLTPADKQGMIANAVSVDVACPSSA
jgi:hypothetical protein